MPLNLNGARAASAPAPNSVSDNKPKEQPRFSLTSPKYSFDDLILPQGVLDELRTVVEAPRCWDTVFRQWGLSSVMKDRENLFVDLYGDPGTGKTMAAHAIAKEMKKDLLCVNYAEIESKYVGETGKNLIALFDFAKGKDIVLFFDEADALLSKRVTNMNNATDVSVNQTRSVLLTLLNDYSGMVIFATNFVSNYDPAFMRRIQYHIKFTLPDEALREKLWRKYTPPAMPTNIDYIEIAKKYEGISGSDISNAVLKAALKAARSREEIVRHDYFCEAVQSIIDSKKANSGYETVTVREVSEEYYKEKTKNAIKSVDLKKYN